jgi:hypothetical protein
MKVSLNPTYMTSKSLKNPSKMKKGISFKRELYAENIPKKEEQKRGKPFTDGTKNIIDVNCRSD